MLTLRTRLKQRRLSGRVPYADAHIERIIKHIYRLNLHVPVVIVL